MSIHPSADATDGQPMDCCIPSAHDFVAADVAHSSDVEMKECALALPDGPRHVQHDATPCYRSDRSHLILLSMTRVLVQKNRWWTMVRRRPSMRPDQKSASLAAED